MSNKTNVVAMSFQRRFDVALYAVRAGVFKRSDIMSDVLDGNRYQVERIIHDLIEVGFLERHTKRTYRATEYAKQLFGVGHG